MVGNAWKQVALNYTVTADTVLEFDFESAAQGEIHAIGFDTDETLSPATAFQVYGTQTGVCRRTGPMTPSTASCTIRFRSVSTSPAISPG